MKFLSKIPFILLIFSDVQNGESHFYLGYAKNSISAKKVPNGSPTTLKKNMVRAHKMREHENVIQWYSAWGNDLLLEVAPNSVYSFWQMMVGADGNEK